MSGKDPKKKPKYLPKLENLLNTCKVLKPIASLYWHRFYYGLNILERPKIFLNRINVPYQSRTWCLPWTFHKLRDEIVFRNRRYKIWTSIQFHKGRGKGRSPRSFIDSGNSEGQACKCDFFRTHLPVTTIIFRIIFCTISKFDKHVFIEVITEKKGPKSV